MRQFDYASDPQQVRRTRKAHHTIGSELPSDRSSLPDRSSLSNSRHLPSTSISDVPPPLGRPRRTKSDVGALPERFDSPFLKAMKSYGSLDSDTDEPPPTPLERQTTACAVHNSPNRFRRVRVNVFEIGSTAPGKVVVLPGAFPQFLTIIAEKFKMSAPDIVVYSEEGAEIDSISDFLTGEVVFVGRRGQKFSTDRGGFCSRLLRSRNHDYSVEQDKDSMKPPDDSDSGSEDSESHAPFWEDPDFDISEKHLQRLFRTFLKEEKETLDKEGAEDKQPQSGSSSTFLPADRSGVISYEALRQGLRTMQVELSDEAMEQMISRIDLDKSGDITEAEFVMAVQTMGLAARLNATSRPLLEDLKECFVYDYNATATKVRKSPGDVLKEPPRPAPGFAVRWIAMTGLHAPSLYGLADVYRLHQLEVEDALKTTERTKLVIAEDGHLQIVLRSLSIKDTPPHNLKDEQINIFRINDTIITVQAQTEGFWIVPLRKRLAIAGSKLRLSDAPFLLYSMVDSIVEHARVILLTLSQRLTKTERIMHKAEPSDSSAVVFEIRRLCRQVHVVREWLKPTAQVVRRLSKLDTNLEKYYNDIIDSVEQMVDRANYLTKWGKAQIEEFKERRTAKMNKAMFTLAAVSSIFLPAQFLAGVYGMNFESMPELEVPYGYYIWWVVVVFLASSIIWTLKFKRWL